MARTPPSRRPANRDGGIQWAKAIVLILALVVIGVVVLRASGKSTSTATGTSNHAASTSTSTSPASGSTTTTTVLPAAQVKVLVLNGATATQPLASTWSAKLHAKGYTTEPPDNATSKVSASSIYVVTPGYLPEAQALAAAIGDPSIIINQTITPSAPITPSEQATANLILVIGPDLASAASTSSTTAGST